MTFSKAGIFCAKKPPFKYTFALERISGLNLTPLFQIIYMVNGMNDYEKEESHGNDKKRFSKGFRAGSDRP